MTFTFEKLIDSIAGQLADNFKDVPIYDSPSFNTSYPCFYVFLVNPKIEDGIDGAYIRDTMLDIVYIQERDSSAQNVELINVEIKHLKLNHITIKKVIQFRRKILRKKLPILKNLKNKKMKISISQIS